MCHNVVFLSFSVLLLVYWFVCISVGLSLSFFVNYFAPMVSFSLFRLQVLCVQEVLPFSIVSLVYYESWTRLLGHMIPTENFMELEAML